MILRTPFLHGPCTSTVLVGIKTKTGRTCTYYFFSFMCVERGGSGYSSPFFFVSWWRKEQLYDWTTLCWCEWNDVLFSLRHARRQPPQTHTHTHTCIYIFILSHIPTDQTRVQRNHTVLWPSEQVVCNVTTTKKKQNQQCPYTLQRRWRALPPQGRRQDTGTIGV